MAWCLDVFAGMVVCGMGIGGTVVGRRGRPAAIASALPTPTVGWIRDRYAAQVKASLGDDSFIRPATGRTMPPEQAIARASQTLLITSLSVTVSSPLAADCRHGS